MKIKDIRGQEIEITNLTKAIKTRFRQPLQNGFGTYSRRKLCLYAQATEENNGLKISVRLLFP